MTTKITFGATSAAITFGAVPSPPVATGIAISVQLDQTVVPVLPAAPIAAPTSWSGYYRVETEGKSDAEILAAIDRVQVHHAAKSVRLTGFVTLIGSRFDVPGGGSYSVAHASITERGTDVELYVSAIATDGRRPKPVTRIYPAVADVPDDAGIVAILISAITEDFVTAADRAAQISRLQQALGGA